MLDDFGHLLCFKLCRHNWPVSNNNRITISKAMKSIPYHSGSTHTGTAIKCACEEILSIPCGLPTRNEYQRCPAPIDAIIII